MFDNLTKEVQIAAQALSGGWTKGHFGIKIALMLPETAPDPSPEVKKAMYDETYSFMRLMTSTYEAATLAQDKETTDEIEQQKTLFRSLFRAVFAVEAAQNSYSGSDKAYMLLYPALKILSPIGWTLVHWRKRVISLTFDKSVVASKDIANAMQFLKLERNTHDDTGAHAWSYGEAKRIIDAVELFSVIRRTNPSCVMIYDRHEGGMASYKSYTDLPEAVADWLRKINTESGSTLHWCKIDFEPTSPASLNEYATLNTQRIVDGTSIEYHVKRLPEQIKAALVVEEAK